MGIRSYSTSESNNIQLGQAGADYVTNATVNSHTYVAIQALTEDCEISATSSDTDVWDSISTIEVPEGCTIYGRWSSVTIGSGDTAIVYRG